MLFRNILARTSRSRAGPAPTAAPAYLDLVLGVYNNSNNNNNHNEKERGIRRSFHSSAQRESSLIIGGVGILTAAYGLQYIHKGYVAFKESREQQQAQQGEADAAAAEEEEADPEAAAKAKAEKKKKAAANPNSVWYSSWFARNFYDGGFEDKMTKREAALILGIRESATPERVKEAYFRILRLNHPDHGGSAYIATKLNEAKETFDKNRE